MSNYSPREYTWDFKALSPWLQTNTDLKRCPHHGQEAPSCLCLASMLMLVTSTHTEKLLRQRLKKHCFKWWEALWTADRVANGDSKKCADLTL